MFYFPGLASYPLWQRNPTQSSTQNVQTSKISPNIDVIFPWLKELEKPSNIKAMRDEYNALIEVLTVYIV